MIKIDPKTNHFEHELLSKAEAIEFIKLLKIEANRHLHAQTEAKAKSILTDCNIHFLAHCFWLCQMANHEIDRSAILDIIKYLEVKHDI